MGQVSICNCILKKNSSPPKAQVSRTWKDEPRLWADPWQRRCAADADAHRTSGRVVYLRWDENLRWKMFDDFSKISSLKGLPSGVSCGVTTIYISDYTWRLNQASWKICSSILNHLFQVGVKIKNDFMLSRSAWTGWVSAAQSEIKMLETTTQSTTMCFKWKLNQTWMSQ